MSPADVTSEAISVSRPAATRPWGIWPSLAWYVLIFEIEGRVYDAALVATGLQSILNANRALGAVNLIVAWGVKLLLIVLAVRLTRIPVRDYLGWAPLPKARDVVLGVTVVVALYAAVGFLILSSGGAGSTVNDYRTALAGGMSPWWYVLRWWPAIFLAPFVEESFFRGFLWRGIQFRFGNGAAFLLTTVLFAAIHYNYWMADGVVDPGSVVQYLVLSAVYGWLRWRSGGTVASMIAHAVNNAGLKVMVIALSAFVP